MTDYFDHFGLAFEAAAARRAHLRWYARLTLRLRTHALALTVGALVVAAPAVAAVSGWFSAGRPDVFYPASSTAGLGRTVPGTRLLPIRVADPDGGPPWGMRLVRTDRGDTCVQVGRVEFGELGSLGIDDSWGNDRKFHAISPNDGVADICGATDAANHGFVSASLRGWAASAFIPSDYGSGPAASYCQLPSPLPGLRQTMRQFPKGSKARAAFQRMLSRQKSASERVHACPSGSLRMIFVGLLGPKAKSITYRTPSGTTETEATVGSVGAYLIVVKQTARNCVDYSRTLLGGSGGCAGLGYTDYPALRAPNAVTSVTYEDGSTCSDQPPSELATTYRQFRARIRRDRDLTDRQATARFVQFLAAHHLTSSDWFRALEPQCPPVGWVAAQQAKLTSADVASPITFTVVHAKQYCQNGPPGMAYKGQIIACDHGVPKGYRRFYVTYPGQHGPAQVLITASFIARRRVRTTNSWYEWGINYPGNSGGGFARTQTDIRRGQRITFTMFEPANRPGVYHGIVSFMQNAGQAGPEGGDYPGHDGSLIVGRFSFKLR